MNEDYECDYCGNIIEDGDDTIFIDRAFLPSGAVFCSVECLLHYLSAYEGDLEDLKPLIDADDKYPLTIPKKLVGGNRTEACSEVENLADKNSAIEKY